MKIELLTLLLKTLFQEGEAFLSVSSLYWGNYRTRCDEACWSIR